MNYSFRIQMIEIHFIEQKKSDLGYELKNQLDSNDSFISRKNIIMHLIFKFVFFLNF